MTIHYSEGMGRIGKDRRLICINKRLEVQMW